MKKWILVIIIVVIGIGVYLVWPKTKLEEPVITSAQFDEVTKTLSVSYIVAKKDATQMKGIYLDQEELYSAEPSNQAQVLVKEGGYELREEIVELSDAQFGKFLSFEGRALPVEITFDGYSSVGVGTILIILLEDEIAEVIEQGEELLYTFIAPEDLTIQTIGHYDSVATISFEEDQHPFVLKKGESTEVVIHGPYKLGAADELLLEIATVDNKYYTAHFPLTQSIPKGYLEQMVKAEQLNRR